MASSSNSRPLRTTRQSSRESAGGGIGTRSGSQRGDDDASSISFSGGGRLRNHNPYGRVYGSVTAPPAALQQQLGGAASRGGGGGGKSSSASVASDGGTEGGGGGGKKVNIPGFLTKTYEIFSSGEYGDLCGWGPHGDTIIIKKVPEFSATVLPRYFKHSNFQSFVRQLNMYDFHKTVQDPSHGEFRHQYFKRGRPDLLPLIKRKVSQPTGAGGSAAATTTTAGAARAPHHPPHQDLKPVLPSPPASPAHTAAAAMMMSMPGSASAMSMDVDGGGAAGGGAGGGSSKPSKSWQKRTETRLQECEDLVKRLSVENHMLWTHVHTTQAMAKALKRTQLRMVGVVQDLLLPSTASISTAGGGGAGAGSSSSGTGAGAAAQMALQKLKAELEALSMSPVATALDGASLDGGLGGAGGVPGAGGSGGDSGGGGGDILSALPPSMAMAAGAGAAGEDGVQLARTMSLSDPLVFWRNVSLGSIPSFGPGAVHSLLDPSTAGAAAAPPTAAVHNNGAAAAPAAATMGAGAGGLMSPPSAPGAPPEGFGRQMSFQRLGSGSGSGGPSRKRSRLTHEAAQGIADQLTVLHRESQTLVGRVDSMEQHLSSILGLDPDAWPESMEEQPSPPTWTAPAPAGGGSRGGVSGGGRGEGAAAAAAAAAGAEGGGGGKDDASAGAGAGTGASVPPPSALEGAPLVKQQAVSMSGAMPPPPVPVPPGDGGTAGID